MDCPKSLTVGGIRIKVAKADLLSGGVFGQYEHDKHLILIDESLEGEDLAETLRHEIMEAALCIGGTAFCEGMETEAMVRCCDSLFFPVWDKIREQYFS
tara:strand:+ start:2604 stop:2900 length:297 start_codon:yes stop_codon:yes gene_type:complete